MKKLNGIIFVLILFFGQDLFAIKKTVQKKSSLLSFIMHPTTIAVSGLASLGGYCFYDQDYAYATYAWLKQHFNERPGVFIGIGAFFGWWLSYCYYERKNTKQTIEKMEESINVLSELLIVDQSDLENITIPAITFKNLCLKFNNLEKIVLGKETDETFFSEQVGNLRGPFSPSRFDLIEHMLDIGSPSKSFAEQKDVLNLQQRLSDIENDFVLHKVRFESVPQTIREIKRMLLEKRQLDPQDPSAGSTNRKPRRLILLEKKGDD